MVCTRPEYHVLVTLPLLVLSVTFHHVLPMAITSLLVSLGVCVVAGAQAAVPRNKARWWSRPLVALLYLPATAGARLGALSRTPARAPRRRCRPSRRWTPSPCATASNRLRQVHYWAEQPLDRLAWAGDILKRLDQQGWPNKADIGWSDYDVEVYDTRWSRLQLATVAEEHAARQANDPLPAAPALGVADEGGLLVALRRRVPVLRPLRLRAGPGSGSCLLTLPLFAWFIRRQQRKLQSMIVILLDELAREWKLTRVIEP